MVLTLNPKLESALNELARAEGVPPEQLALRVLEERLARPDPIVPRDDWERRLLALGSDYGVSLPDEALTREAIYD